MVTRNLIPYLLVSGFLATIARGETLVPRGSDWRYLADGSGQGTEWREVDFDDSGWETGPAPIGYGDDLLHTVIPTPPPPRPITLYFRHAFELNETPEWDTFLESALRRDDGAVVYLNGVELRRDNMPSGVIGFLTSAVSPVGGTDELEYYPAIHAVPELLRIGRNVVALELHSQNVLSADAFFDFELNRIDGLVNRFLARPPLTVDFEHREVPVARAGTGVIHRLAPDYSGWDYLYNAPFTQSSIAGPLARARVAGRPFPSSALCVSGTTMEFRTAPAATFNVRDVALSVDLFAEKRTAFAPGDSLMVDAFVALPGDRLTFVRFPWLEIASPEAMTGEALVSMTPDALVSPDGGFSSFATPPGFLPDDAAAVLVRVEVRSATSETAFYIDNLALTGTKIEADDYASFMQSRAERPSIPPPDGDLDRDGVGNFVEYALGGDPFHAGGTRFPALSITSDGFAEFSHPVLGGDLGGDPDRGLQVADVRYRAQFSPDGRVWRDGLGESLFSLLSTSPSGVRLRSHFPLARAYPTGLFRVRVEPAVPIRASHPLADPFALPVRP